MTPTLHGTYDHGRLLLEGEPPWPRAAVLVTFLREEPLPTLKQFAPSEFAFDDCRSRLPHLRGVSVSTAVDVEREERR